MWDFSVTCGTNTFQRQPDQKILSDALQALHQNNVKPETEQNKKGFIWMLTSTYSKLT